MTLGRALSGARRCAHHRKHTLTSVHAGVCERVPIYLMDSNIELVIVGSSCSSISSRSISITIANPFFVDKKLPKLKKIALI